MTSEEAHLINGLHNRLDQAAPQPLDSEAESLISSRVIANPHAPYLLTQSVLVLQQALIGAQTRIADLEKQLAEAKSQAQQSGGSFLSGVANLFGTSQPAPAPARQVAPPSVPQQAVVAAPGIFPSQGGSFLQSALVTAAGVAGGALLFRGIENLMGHNAGSFGGMGGMGSSGGFLGQNQPTEITNNYYDSPSDASQGDSNFDNSGDTRLADNHVTSTDFDQDQDMDFSGGDDSSFG
ncbi:MAG: DUF2076 domain-containing protein [Verrucomicrobia bacterium]|nr:DUF2076 domain-containing protein [Verrucomicrobiota bacterium]